MKHLKWKFLFEMFQCVSLILNHLLISLSVYMSETDFFSGNVQCFKCIMLFYKQQRINKISVACLCFILQCTYKSLRNLERGRFLCIRFKYGQRVCMSNMLSDGADTSALDPCADDTGICNLCLEYCKNSYFLSGLYLDGLMCSIWASFLFFCCLLAICFLFWIKAIWFNGCDLGNKHGFEANNFSDLYKNLWIFRFHLYQTLHLLNE